MTACSLLVIDVGGTNIKFAAIRNGVHLAEKHQVPTPTLRDGDLLLIAPPNAPRHKSIGHLSMFFYPWEQLAEDAQAGDLFVCHIVREAKPVFDPLSQLEKLRSLFRLRSSYAREVAHAGALGWMLDRHAGELNPQVVSRRMIWCVRTILIARLAECGTPEFAPAALAAFAPESAAALLGSRHQHRIDATMRHRFRYFLSREAGSPPLPANATVEDYRNLFDRTGNHVGLHTIELGSSDAEEIGNTYR